MKPKITFTHTFTLFGIIHYYFVLAAMVALIVVRHNAAAWQQLPLIGEYAVGSHVSNFALVVLYLFTIGSIHMMVTRSWRYIIVNAVALVVINIVVELFIRLLNTPDIDDAAYGLAGVAVALGLLVVMRRYGLRPYSK